MQKALNKTWEFIKEWYIDIILILNQKIIMKKALKKLLNFVEKHHIDIVLGIVILISSIAIPIILITLFGVIIYIEMENFHLYL